MKCPSCAMPLEAAAPRCPHCRVSLQKLDTRFGLVPAHSRLLSDRSGTLTLPEMKQLRAKLRIFDRKFPQALLSVFVTELAAGTSLSEYAFWLANRARFNSADRVRAENYNLLLVIDLANGAAALTTGYGLESYVAEDALLRALDDFASEYHARGLAAGIEAAIASLSRQLRDLALQSTAQPGEERRGVETW